MKYWQFVKIINEQQTAGVNMERADIYMAGEHVFSDLNLKDAAFLDVSGLPGGSLLETLKIKNAQGLTHYLSLDAIESIVVKEHKK